MPSVYIHIPFCTEKCPYCDFYSEPLGAQLVPDTYVAALCRDIQRHLRTQSSLSSVFIGGGTPSLLSVEQVEHIIAAIHTVATLDSGLEFSIEVNPATTTTSWLRDIRVLGVERLSVGVQSFQDEALNALGRAHTGSEALACIESARAAGFENINIDMMFALPGLDAQARQHAWMKADQNMIAHLAPEHVSVYGLTLESDTPFGVRYEQGLLHETGEEDFRAQFLDWHHTLAEQGYFHYEISNYALAGRECRHNLAYWERKTCFACGAGAHGFDSAGWGIRSASAPDADGYITAVQSGDDPRHEVERFDAQEAMAEWVYLRLRTAQGVEETEFFATFGVEFSRVYANAIRTCGTALHQEAGRWYFPPQEWLLYNHHVQAFLT